MPKLQKRTIAATVSCMFHDYHRRGGFEEGGSVLVEVSRPKNKKNQKRAGKWFHTSRLLEGMKVKKGWIIRPKVWGEKNRKHKERTLWGNGVEKGGQSVLTPGGWGQGVGGAQQGDSRRPDRDRGGGKQTADPWVRGTRGKTKDR